MHYSKQWGYAPMPHSVFFHNGYAIHGTNHTRALGRPASHGCVRLSPGNARKLYRLIQQHSKVATRISVFGKTPAYRRRARKTRVASYVKRSKSVGYSPKKKAAKYRRRKKVFWPFQGF